MTPTTICIFFHSIRSAETALSAFPHYAPIAIQGSGDSRRNPAASRLFEPQTKAEASLGGSNLAS
jgi:hypothetical protein